MFHAHHGRLRQVPKDCPADSDLSVPGFAVLYKLCGRDNCPGVQALSCCPRSIQPMATPGTIPAADDALPNELPPPQLPAEKFSRAALPCAAGGSAPIQTASYSLPVVAP